MTDVQVSNARRIGFTTVGFKRLAMHGLHKNMMENRCRPIRCCDEPLHDDG